MKHLGFIETIKVKNGEFCNIDLHQQRMDKTIQDQFDLINKFVISEIDVPSEFREGLVKCRILYFCESIKIEWFVYHLRELHQIRIVENNKIDYSYKFADRSSLNTLSNKKGDTEEVLIVKNGKLTDTSFSNLVLQNEEGFFTPDTYLLNGTKRQLLLKKGIIRELEIRIEDLLRYEKLYLINAMIDLEDTVCVHTTSVIW